jgi:hypothetical protein
MDFPIELENGLRVVSAKNPMWANKAHTVINMLVTVEEPDGKIVEVPFAASPDDNLPHGRALFDWGKSLSVQPWERPDVTSADLQVELDKLLPDVMLGLASPEEVELAKLLRIQIKAMAQ